MVGFEPVVCILGRLGALDFGFRFEEGFGQMPEALRISKQRKTHVVNIQPWALNPYLFWRMERLLI